MLFGKNIVLITGNAKAKIYTKPAQDLLTIWITHKEWISLFSSRKKTKQNNNQKKRMITCLKKIKAKPYLWDWFYWVLYSFCHCHSCGQKFALKLRERVQVILEGWKVLFKQKEGRDGGNFSNFILPKQDVSWYHQTPSKVFCYFFPRCFFCIVL